MIHIVSCFIIFATFFFIKGYYFYQTYEIWSEVPCEKYFLPEYCLITTSSIQTVTVEDMDRCAPAKLTLSARNYYLAGSGRKYTYMENLKAFRRIEIIPRVLRNVSSSNIKTTILGIELDFPIGLAPVAVQKLAHHDGEFATVAALSKLRTIMILSTFSSASIEKVGKAAAGTEVTLWMQIYMFRYRNITVDIIRKAEKSGFKGIVLTADSNIVATLTCNAKRGLLFPAGVRFENVGFTNFDDALDAMTPEIIFHDIIWLRSITSLPIIVKGILTGDDAARAIHFGADAIIVSNHGGRQLDGSPATIDALPNVVETVQKINPNVEVYMDGGIRSGTDVYKAIALGAKMVFVGRPIVWGLALAGAKGVEHMINFLKEEFNQTMLLAGHTSIRSIETGEPSLITQCSFS